MKKIWLVICVAFATENALAQIGMPPEPLPPAQHVYTPLYHVPDYSQNNSSYTNNSMQNNKPANPNAGAYTGNGDYVDPTRNATPPPVYYNNGGQLPTPPPANNPNVPDNTNSTIYKR
jgi:hypothetical protein